MIAAMESRMIGTSNAMPLANIKHTINAGSATTIRILAMTFATPQVSLNIKPMDFANSQRKTATVRI